MSGPCENQKKRTRFVEDELKRLGRRLERDKVVLTHVLCVFAYNCDAKEHGNPDTLHIDFVATGGVHPTPIPQSNEAAIVACETLLKALKAKAQ